MNLFVAGATGVLGRRLVDQLTDRGHDVVGLVRDDVGERAVRSRGGTPAYGDVLDREGLLDTVDDADVVIHAATAIPTANRPSADDWERNDRIRTEGTKNLWAAAEAADVDQFIFQSVVWLARQPDGEPFDEGSPPNPDRTTESALEAERFLENVARDSNIHTCVLRGGWFYAPDAAHTRQFGEGLLAGRLPIVGGGLLGRTDAALSIVHADDAAAAYAAAVEASLTGTYHVVDERPVTFADFIGLLADRLGASNPRRVPGWLARFVVGRDTVLLLTNSMPTSADRLRAVTDWTPTYPTYEDGIDAIVDDWFAEGTIEATDDGYAWVEDLSV
ncbi:NAD-dependent epimerase/dehydratase family protein [Halovivax gelatinilyticus]|uniref:NAD-dependent epimerase/dehydratase family protein n=1 Tax=Halovivax gelatinilyticus TaxID=2961597 RepID=UPI0020CA6733|nr:NAD(P)-dependent oxidoreductase [Halovivax gelatinilyticus]